MAGFTQRVLSSQRIFYHEKHESHEISLIRHAELKKTTFYPAHPVHPRLRRASPVKTGFVH